MDIAYGGFARRWVITAEKANAILRKGHPSQYNNSV